MKQKSRYIQDILSNLGELNPYRIVLFGSHATETHEEYSDLDFLVILDSDFVPKTYEEKMKKKLLVRDRILEINKRVPIDLVVYTRAEYEILEKNGGSFLNEIKNNGKTLYKKTSP